MEMKKIMLISLILLLFISLPNVCADDNMTCVITSDNSPDVVSSDDTMNYVITSDNSSDVVSLDDTINIEDNLELDEGEYVDASDAYRYLNDFRCEENVWYWNYDDTTQSHVNNNDTVWLKPLERDVELENTAKIRAKEISEFFSHTRPDGTKCFTAFPDDLLDMGENIAYGYGTCFDVTEGWKETNDTYQYQGHRRNMLQADYNCVGIAGYKINGVIYWVQNFGCRYNPQNTNATLSVENNTENPKFTIELPMYASGSFSVSVNGVPISSKPISNGKSQITVCGLNNGTYEVFLSYSGDYNCNPFNKTLSIAVPDHTKNKTLSFNDLNTLIKLSGDEIRLENDYAYTESLDSSFQEGIEIYKHLTIDGQGHTIDGKNMARIFRIAHYVTLENISITNTNANAIPDKNGYFDSSSYGPASYYSAVIKANRDGGAIYAQYPLYIINSTFANNCAHDGGAVYSYADIYMEGSVFTANRADNDGGAAYSGNSVHITNTNLTDNYALDLGGAIYCKSKLESTNSVFKNNTNVRIFAGEYSIKNTTFIEDEYMSLFSNANSDNAVITLDKDYNATGTVLVSGSNVIINGNGHTINAQNKSRAFYITANNVTIKNITIINGYSTSVGGAIYDVAYSLTITDSRFDANTAQEGGAVYGSATDIIIKSTSFNNNHARDFSGSEITQGGAVCTKTGTLTIINSSFENNSAYYGGAVHTDTGLILLEGSSFKNNSALLYAGGAIHTKAEVNVLNSSFTANYAPKYGGAIFCYGEFKLYICDSTFTNNTSNHYGGAISTNAECEIINSSFTRNYASDHAGAICLWDMLSVIGSNFTDNYAGVAGGAIYDYAPTGAVSISSSNFINNTQKSFGALYLTSNVVVRDSSFVNNRAFDGVGGGICCYQNLTVINSTFTNNSAARSWGYSVGGAITNYCENLSVKDCTFKSNSAHSGGAIANFNGNAIVDNSNFTANTAQNGGGLYNAPNTQVHVENSVFEENYADYGGAISNDNFHRGEDGYEGAVVYVKNTQFKNNTAFEGGAIHNLNSTAIITESTFTDNAGSRGESISDNMGSTNLINSTLSNSFAVDSALLGHVTQTNSTILENGTDVTGEYATGTRKVMSTVTLSSEEITLDWGTTASVSVSFANAKGFTASVVNHAEAKVTIRQNTIEISNLDAGSYVLKVTTVVDSDHDSATAYANITVNRLSTSLSASKVTVTYATTKKIVVILKDAHGTVAGRKITVKLKNVIYKATTDANGKAYVAVPKNLAVGNYNAAVAFAGDGNYVKSSTTVKVTVKKATPKLTAKAKTFKKSVKTKIYTVTLKNNLNKVMKYAKVTIKVNKITYTAKTNAKGVATFKITKLTKKGTFKSVVTYNGSGNYNKITKKVNINVK
jgi:predicted outer membrane repeat protein